MNTTHLPDERSLEIHEQIEQANTISGENINCEQSQPITPAQAVELDRRNASYLKNPDDAIPWSEVKAALP